MTASRQHNNAISDAADAGRPFSDLLTGMTYNFWYPIEFGVII